jgi:hypothetical protein
MKRWFSVAVLALVAAAAACGGGSSKTTASNTTSTASTPNSSASSTAPASGAPAHDGSSAEAQTILQALENVEYDKTASTTFKNVEAANKAVLAAVPGSSLTVFGSTEATDTMISGSGSFLIAGEFDQLLAYAFLNGGKCEAVAAVIPQASASKVSEDKFPSKFVVIDMTNAPKCTASEAEDAYRP